ncbi:MAG: glycosyltransferase family 4 protein [Deltaproteobacteria bacterium]|nr:glycosyltransferase family 4 protein [Deltaproteobacteria bacterium]MBW1928603.1 glycosyltransferase family 4 protein [Deltaproteobacteria bacterium]MBW2025474.1 glycosyltransferase family 4 protein [Deltaproteobacteria bacterium]MBW2125414.1 glycosyltransferase family 4 protein [Deltaproteobacteria bacterium]RLB15281.1 MAG: glycosyl transferase family 1 [Deltaproteobacteria bacterium]
MQRPLRIGILHYSCPPVVGGVEELLKQHAYSLNRLGHQVSILAGMGDVFAEEFPVRIEPVLGSKHPQVLKAHEEANKGSFKPLKRLTERILRILEGWSENLDVIVAHNVLQMPFNLPFTLALRRFAAAQNAVAVVSWAHDSPYFQENVSEILEQYPWNVLRRPHPAIHYVTISESRRELFWTHDSKIHWEVIPNGIDPVTFFYLDPRSVKLAEELNLFARDLVIVQPSRITPRKNLELSIHIVRGIKLLGYNVLFVLTGAYDPHEARAISYYRRLRYWINELNLKDNIAILAEYRFKDRTKLVPDRIFIRDMYLMADLLLMTSKDEGFGLPLLEAGMIKLPIACSDIPPFKEIGEEVCFFRPTDPPLFTAGRIIEYLSRTNTHKMFRKVMRQYILDTVCKNTLVPYLYKVVDKDPGNGRSKEAKG